MAAFQHCVRVGGPTRPGTGRRSDVQCGKWTFSAEQQTLILVNVPGKHQTRSRCGGFNGLFSEQRLVQ